MRLAAVIIVSLFLSACTSDTAMLGLAGLLLPTDKNEGTGNIYAQGEGKPLMLTNLSESRRINLQDIPITYYPDEADGVTDNPFYDEDTNKPAKVRQTEHGPVHITPVEEPLMADKISKKVTKPTVKQNTMNKSTNKKTPTKTSKTKIPTIKGKVTCSQFANHTAAQAYFEARRPGWARLDRDNDGIACEHL